MGKPSSSSSPASPAAIATTRRTSSSTPAVAKSASQDDMKRKKKKGRPSLLDLQKRQQQQQQKINTNNNKTLVPSQKVQVSAAPRRSSRRNPLNSDLLNRRDGYTYDDDDDDDDERQQKKVKLVVRLPQSSSDQGQQFRDSPSRNSQDSSSPGSDSDTDDAREREINAVDHRSTDAGPDQGEKAVKATDTVHGSSLESGPTTPLPDKTMLVFVLDRLQKKDTYGVFSEPVDPNELPDYHEIIEHPMDFGTVRKKLDGGAYNNLEELEADVVLICSNAMQYNSSDTVYFRQARSIQELAKRDFDNLRNEGDNGEPQPKVVRRGRPPSKNLKKPSETSPVDHVGLEVSSGATPASGEDKASGSNGYNLRKGPMFYKFRSNDASGTSLRTRNGENYSDWLVDWNSEFPASILRADMKYGKKHFSVDENRRDTYKQFDPSPSSSTQSYFLNAFGDVKRLMAVGLHMDSHAYARSLARYAANLGPVAWNVACRKLNSALPDGIPFGPGWVEENDVPLPFSPDKFKLMKGFVCDHDSNSRPVDPSTPTPDLSCAVQRQSGEDADTAKRLSCQNESTNVGGGLSWTTPGTPFQTPQKSIFHPGRNGWNGMFGFDLSAQMGGMARVANPAGQSGLEDGSVASQMVGRQSSGEVSALHPRPPPHQASSEQYGNFLSQATDTDTQIVSEAGISGSRSLPQVSSTQLRQPIAIPPDLNIRVQQQASGSPSSSLQIGSPQPDLALQL